MSTAELAERPAKPRKYELRFPVKFNRALNDLGPEVATLAFSVDKDFLSAAEADTCLSGHRINVRIMVGDGDPDQKTFWEGVSNDIGASAHVKGFRCGAKKISSTLIFHVDDVDARALKPFAKKTGWMYVLKAEQVETDEEADTDPADEGEPEDEGEQESE